MQITSTTTQRSTVQSIRTDAPVTSTPDTSAHTTLNLKLSEKVATSRMVRTRRLDNGTTTQRDRSSQSDPASASGSSRSPSPRSSDTAELKLHTVEDHGHESMIRSRRVDHDTRASSWDSQQGEISSDSASSEKTSPHLRDANTVKLRTSDNPGSLGMVRSTRSETLNKPLLSGAHRAPEDAPRDRGTVSPTVPDDRRLVRKPRISTGATLARTSLHDELNAPDTPKLPKLSPNGVSPASPTPSSAKADRSSKRRSLRLFQSKLTSSLKGPSASPDTRTSKVKSPTIGRQLLSDLPTDPIELEAVTHSAVQKEFASWVASGGTILRGDSAFTRQIRGIAQPEFRKAVDAMLRTAVDMLLPRLGKDFTMEAGQMRISPEGDAAMADALRHAMKTFLSQQDAPRQTLLMIDLLRREIRTQAATSAHPVSDDVVQTMIAAALPAVLLRGFSNAITDTRVAVFDELGRSKTPKGDAPLDMALVQKLMAELTKQFGKVSNQKNLQDKGNPSGETFKAVDELINTMSERFADWLRESV